MKDFLAFFLGWLPPRPQPNQANILMYHSVSRDGLFFCVRPAAFQKQMAYLARHHYRVVFLSELSRYFSAGQIPPKTVAITFDDGYEDNYFEVFPVLRQYGFPATVFLTTGWVASADNKVGKQIMNREQIRQMHDSRLIDFQPHTVSHDKLNSLSKAAAAEEILGSKKFLDELLNKNCRFFAYPHGKFNEDTLAILRDNNFEFGLTTDKGLAGVNDDRYRLRRNAIDSQTSLARFRVILKFGRF